MRKWGLYYLCLLMLAVVLAGCSAADNNAASDGGSMSNSLVAKDEAESTMAMASTANQNTSAEPAITAGGSEDSAVKGATSENTDLASAGFTGSDVAAGLNKKLIYHANLNMEVENYGKTQTEIRNMVTLAKGYIIEFNESMSQYEQGERLSSRCLLLVFLHF